MKVEKMCWLKITVICWLYDCSPKKYKPKFLLEKLKRLLVSTPAWKQLEIHQCVQTEKSTTLRAVKEVKSQSKPLPPILQAGRWIHGITTYWSRKPRAERETSTGNSGGIGTPDLSYDWQIAGGSVWTTLRLKTPKETSHRSPPHFSEFYLLELYQVFMVNNREKSPDASRREGEKEAIWNIPEHSVLTKFALRRNDLRRA